MRFEFPAGTEYRIWFQYTNHGARRETLCAIDRNALVPTVKGERVAFAAGSSVCAATDQFRKETGRKVALTRALRSVAFPGDINNSKAKLFRTAAWKCYLNRADSDIRENAGGA